MWWREFYPRSRPKAVRGGIRAQSARGQFGSTWWGRRWVEVLEGFDIGARLGRGRSYARDGQVLSIDVKPGQVSAKVQGSRPSPYRVTIALQVLGRGDWDRVIDALNRKALYTAKLLAGEMPAEIEDVFRGAGLSLFPKRSADLETACSCPDWSNPCKHIAAVYYLLAEQFDRDPFLLLKLRGLDRDALLSRLKSAVPAAAATESPRDPLPADAAAFWGAAKVPDDIFGPVEPPPVSAALPKRLGAFPYWRGSRPLIESLIGVYGQASQRGLAVFLGETPPPA